MSVNFLLESYETVSLNWRILEHTQSNDPVETSLVSLVFGESKGTLRTKLVFGELERTPRTNWSSVNPKEYLRQLDCK